jgi:hypothetical protein
MFPGMCFRQVVSLLTKQRAPELLGPMQREEDKAAKRGQQRNRQILCPPFVAGIVCHTKSHHADHRDTEADDCTCYQATIAAALSMAFIVAPSSLQCFPSSRLVIVAGPRADIDAGQTRTSDAVARECRQPARRGGVVAPKER